MHANERDLRQDCACGVEVKRSSAVLAAAGVCCAIQGRHGGVSHAEVEGSYEVLVAGGVCLASIGVRRASAGQDRVGGIDHGPGSNQPVHHLRMAVERRSLERSQSVLRIKARREVKRESLCCPCQTQACFHTMRYKGRDSASGW
jgi:hypothetical protein